jgi:hypothetical protein
MQKAADKTLPAAQNHKRTIGKWQHKHSPVNQGLPVLQLIYR